MLKKILIGEILAVGIISLTNTVNQQLTNSERLPNVIQHVIEGKDATKSYPWFARIGWSGEDNLKVNKFLGGGVLIEPDWVLTAAHVVAPFFSAISGFSHLNPTVTFGLSDLEHDNLKNVQTASVEKIFLPDDFFNQPSFRSSDLALLKLTHKVDNIKPISYFYSSLEMHYKIKKSKIIGFGWNDREKIKINDWENYRVKFPTKLQEAEIDLISYEEYEKNKMAIYDQIKDYNTNNEDPSTFFENSLFNKDNEVLAGHIKPDPNNWMPNSSHGDSGGPLFQEIEGESHLVGIVKGGFGPYLNDKKIWAPAVYSSVHKQYNWISSTISGYYTKQKQLKNFENVYDSLKSLEINELKTRNQQLIENVEVNQIVSISQLGLNAVELSWPGIEYSSKVTNIDRSKGEITFEVILTYQNKQRKLTLKVWGFYTQEYSEIQTIKKKLEIISKNQPTSQKYPFVLKGLEIGDILTKEELGFDQEPAKSDTINIKYVVKSIVNDASNYYLVLDAQITGTKYSANVPLKLFFK